MKNIIQGTVLGKRKGGTPSICEKSKQLTNIQKQVAKNHHILYIIVVILVYLVCVIVKAELLYQAATMRCSVMPDKINKPPT